MGKRSINFDQRQYQKHLNRQKKREEEGDYYTSKGFPKPLLPGIRYRIDSNGSTYVVELVDKRKDRDERCYVYQAKVEEYVKPGEDDYYTWGMYGRWGMRFSRNDFDGLWTIKHHTSNGVKIRRLTDSGYAKLLLIMNERVYDRLE
jgi:hypothetical protein